MGLFTTNPVFDMLKKDHKKVQELFDQFESAEDSRSKVRIVPSGSLKSMQSLRRHSFTRQYARGLRKRK